MAMDGPMDCSSHCQPIPVSILQRGAAFGLTRELGTKHVQLASNGHISAGDKFAKVVIKQRLRQAIMVVHVKYLSLYFNRIPAVG